MISLRPIVRRESATLRSLDISALLAIEPTMYFGIGFLAATLIAVATISVVHNRAVRLTTRRIMSSMPKSMAEVVAEKDRMRAMFAVAVRGLETKVEELIKKVAAYAAQLGRQTAVNKQLKEALDEKSKLVAALEVREGALMSRENSLIQELLALRDETRRTRDSALSTRLPSAPSPWK